MTSLGWAGARLFVQAYWQGFHSDNAHKPQTNNITNTDDPELDKLIIVIVTPSYRKNALSWLTYHSGEDP